MEESKHTPERIWVNRNDGQIHPEGYPNTEEYVRVSSLGDEIRYAMKKYDAERIINNKLRKQIEELKNVARFANEGKGGKKKMYATPISGSYSHRTPNYDGTFSEAVVAVDVLGESEKRYLVRLKMPVENHKQNEELWVRKHNVSVVAYVRREGVPEEKYDYSNAYWNK